MRTASSERVAGASRTIGALDLLRLRLVDDPQLAPGTELLAYVEIYCDLDADGQMSEVIVRTVDGPVVWRSGGGARDSCPRWSVDGALAFVSDRVHGPQCWLVEPSRGVAEQLTDLPAAVTDLDWSATGDRIAVCTSALEPVSLGGPAWRTTQRAFKLDGRRSPGRQRRQLHVVARDGSTTYTLAMEGDAWCPRFSPDTDRLAFVTDEGLPGLPEQSSAIWSVDSALAGPAERLADRSGPVRTLCWSPDGSAVAFIGHQQGERCDVDDHVLVADIGRRSVTDLTPEMDRSAGMAVRGDDRRGYGPPVLRWSDRTDRIYFEVAEGGRGPLGWVEPSGKSGRLYGGDRVCLAPALGPDGTRLAVVVIDAEEPGAVSVGDESGDELRPVANANAWLTGCALGKTSIVRAGATDGAALEAWLTLPPAPGRVAPPWPLLVSVHGGPHNAVGWRFSFDAQRIAARGVAVLAPNPRGSLGYGREFAAGNVGDWGGPDWSDVCALIDAAVARGETDPERIGIHGASYGGYLAQWAITRSDRFRVAISENGISNLFSQWGTGADGGTELSAELGATPWDGPSRLVDRSPLRYADRANTPLLLVHSELDQNCPLEQSEQMYTALKFLGRQVELAVLEGEGHLVNLVGRPSRRLARAAIIDEYLDRHLVGPPAVRPPSS